MTHPFPYFGQGSGRGDELAPLVVFESEIPAAEMQRLVATAPPPFRHGVKTGARWLWLSTTDRYLADARRWAREAKLTIGRRDEVAYAAMSEALERWILEVHREHPVALFFVDSIQDDPEDVGAWHAWSMAHYAEGVRPVVARLRADGAADHASLGDTATAASGGLCWSALPMRLLASAPRRSPPTEVGNINRRCISIVRLMQALGDDVLAELGPYVELGYWAAAAVPAAVLSDERWCG